MAWYTRLIAEYHPIKMIRLNFFRTGLAESFTRVMVTKGNSGLSPYLSAILRLKAHTF